MGRFDASTSPPILQYSFPVPNGWYDVRLYFAEPGLAPGGRQFNVQIEGSTVYTNLDVAAEAGVFTALIKQVNVRVSDGQLDLAFLHGAADNPFIDAIEIFGSSAPTTPIWVSGAAPSGTQVNLNWTPSTDSVGVAGYLVERCQGGGCTSFAQIATPTAPGYSDSGLSPLTTYRYRLRSVDTAGNQSAYSDVVTVNTLPSVFSTIRINAGGGAYTDSSGHLWSADTGFNSGTLYSANCTISGTNDPSLFTVGRFDSSSAPPTLQYDFQVPNGTYQVNLYFAEPGIQPGGRKFNVVVQGATVFANLDVASEAGVCAALVKSTVAQVSNGDINLQFLHGSADNPFIDAIEILQTAAVDTRAPTVPAALAASSMSNRVDLTWNVATDNVGVTAYHLERCTGIGCVNFVELAALPGTSYSDNNVSAQTTYRYRVRAADSASNYSAYSPPIAADTGDTDLQAPSAPSNLAATTLSSSSVGVSWGAATDNVGVTEYHLESCRGIGCVHFAEIAAPTGTSFVDSGLDPGVSYSYRVVAADAAGNRSSYSNVASATTSTDSADAQPPTAPSSATAVAYSANRVDVSWAVSTDNVAVTGYFIERCIGTSCTDFSQIAAVPSLTGYSDTGLTGGVIYRYRIRAGDASGNLSAYSPIATASSANGKGTAGSATYQYDSLGRLKQVIVTPN